MSMHATVLTKDEEEGLQFHRLPIGTPSQLSDAFRLGMKWASRKAKPPGGSVSWIPWPGDQSMPVQIGTIVDVEYRDGHVVYGIPVGSSDVRDPSSRRACDWTHSGYGVDIVAYRVVKERA